MDKLIKPYEISIWEDTLDTSTGGSEYKETKIAVIGSNTMEGYNKVYEPVFTKKTNGEKILTFSLKYQYFDPYIGATVTNPFASYLINERKVKLYYDNQWYEFLIKEHTESSDGLVWKYTATDAFVNELSKIGYGKEFDVELGNNQGTAIELAKVVVDGTDWTVDETNSSVGPQEISEAIYSAKLNSSSAVTIVNAETGDVVTFEGTPSIFVFYNYVANKDGQFVQFILQESNPNNYVVDDNNTIKATNYRIKDELVYDESGVFKKKNTTTNIITITKIGSRLDLSTEYYAYRKVYGQLSTYDPVMGRTVKRYKLEGLNSEIYNYTDYIYSTSDVVTNFITNGDKFNIYDNGSLQGWSQNAQSSVISDGETIYATTNLVTYPPIKADSTLKSLTSYTQIEGYMEVKFPGIIDNYRNGIFNTGIEDSAGILKSISAGEEFVFRWRGAVSSSQQGALSAMGNDIIRVVVAKYKKSDSQSGGRYYNILDPNNIILDFNTTAQILDNVITGGIFPKIGNTNNVDYSVYEIDGVAQEPSTKYIYKYNGQNYVWDSRNENDLKYVPLNSSAPFFPHYQYMVATAQRGITEAELSEPSTNIGIFIYTKGGAGNYYYFQDIQLTRLYKDGENNILTIGNMPTATAVPVEYYYVKPKKGTTAEKVEIYKKLSALANSLGTIEANIKPIYNENSTKYLSISESHSNCYNLLQTIAETFECWIDLVVSHNSKGEINYTYRKTTDTQINTAKIYYTRSGSSGSYTYTPVIEPVKSSLSSYYERRQNKKVVLREYVGKDNFAGFKYGINLNTIERTINSDEIVTKLYVTPAQSEYVDEGSVAIGYASMNPSGEQYILNFDYYYKQGLITNISDARTDVNSYYTTMNEINTQLRAREKERRNLEASLITLNSQRNVYSNLIDEAKNNVNEGKDDFKSLTGKTYDGYRTQKTSEQIRDLYYFPTNDTTVYKYKDYFKQISGTSGNTYEKVNEFEDGTNPSAKHYYEYIPDLEKNNTLTDLIAKIYINSYTINNYAGILTNIEREYKRVRADLKGSEEFTVTIGLIDTGSSLNKLKVTVSDYITGFKFTVGSASPCETNVNTKEFEINTTSSTITINKIPSGYTLVKSNGQVINENGTVTASTDKIITLTLKPNIQFDGVEDKIEKLEKIKEEAERWFHNKYNRFIQEGTWSSTDYIDSNLYYLDAVSVSNTSAQPQVSYSINVVEISELEGYKWFNFDAGDKTYVEDIEFFGWSDVGGILTPAREEVIVSEVEWHLEEPENNIITVQNYKTRFEDLFQRVSATVQTVEYNEATYAKTSSLMDAYGILSQTVLLESLNNISGQPYTLTSDGSIRIDGNRIIIRDLKNKANVMTLESTGIHISSDGEKTWATAIDAYGINLGVATFGKLNTNKITIGSDSNPSFRWDKSGISAYKKNGDDTYDLNTYVRFDQYGLYGITRDSSFIADSLEDVKNKAHFAVTWDGFFIKNSYTGGGKVQITSANDFQVINSNNQEKIKIGALEWKRNGVITTTPIPGVAPSLYGIRINNNAGQTVFKTGDDGNLEITGTIYANAGEIGGMSVTQNTLHMNHTLFERGVGIYSDILTDNKPLFEISDINGHATFRYIEALGGKLGNLSVINTLTVGDGTSNGLIKSYNYVSSVSGWKVDSTGYAEFSNATVRGHIEATSGDFIGWVAVGDRTQNPQENPWIIISGGATDAAAQAYGSKAIIKTSNYSDGASYGWMIDASGDAVFNNITARGAIKTAVFEYAEIEAVGGIFIFRPSSTIKSARLGNTTKGENVNDLIVTVEKPLLFDIGSWCKVSNYTANGREPDIEDVTVTNGLTHVYKVIDRKLVDDVYEITLAGGKALIDVISEEANSLVGGALISFGFAPNTYIPINIASVPDIGPAEAHLYELVNGNYILTTDTVAQTGKTYYREKYQNGIHNYGIGINSSDNTVNLPARAITLFETQVNPNEDIKVTYDYKGVLGTLPILSSDKAKDSLYNTYMAGTQGIYTDNMYIGDNKQYIAFYEDNLGDKHLKISAKEMVYGYDEDTGEEITWQQKIDENKGADATQLVITSTIGEYIINSVGQGAIHARIFVGGQEDDPIKTTIFSTTPPPGGDYYYHLDSTNKTCVLKKKVNDSWINAPSSDLPKYIYTWTFRDKNGQPTTYNGRSSVTGKAIYIDGDMIDNKIIVECNVTDS